MWFSSLQVKIIFFDNKVFFKIFPKINFILENNAVEPKGIKSNYFGEYLSKLI